MLFPIFGGKQKKASHPEASPAKRRPLGDRGMQDVVGNNNARRSRPIRKAAAAAAASFRVDDEEDDDEVVVSRGRKGRKKQLSRENTAPPEGEGVAPLFRNRAAKKEEPRRTVGRKIAPLFLSREEKRAEEERRAEAVRLRQRELRAAETSAFGGSANNNPFFAARAVGVKKRPKAVDDAGGGEMEWLVPVFPPRELVFVGRVASEEARCDALATAIVERCSGTIPPSMTAKEGLELDGAFPVARGDKATRDDAVAAALDALRNETRPATTTRKLWIDEHASDLTGAARKVLLELADWFAEFDDRDVDDFDDDFDDNYEWGEASNESAALVVGPVGTGKTSVARTAASSAGFEVLEIDAGESQTAAELKNQYAEATQSRRLERRTLLIIDNVDAARVKESGLAKSLRKLVLGAKCPIIATASDVVSPADLAETLGCARYYVLERLATSDLVDHLLERVGKRRFRGGAEADWRLVCESVAARAAGDARKAINHLQLALASRGVNDDDATTERNLISGAPIREDVVDDAPTFREAAAFFPEEEEEEEELEFVYDQTVPRILSVSPREVASDGTRRIELAVRLDPAAAPVRVLVDDLPCSAVEIKKPDTTADRLFFLVSAVVPPRTTEGKTEYAQVVLVTRQGRRSDLALCDRHANHVTIEYVRDNRNRKSRGRLRKNARPNRDSAESLLCTDDDTEDPQGGDHCAKRRRRVVDDEESRDDDAPSDGRAMVAPEEPAVTRAREPVVAQCLSREIIEPPTTAPEVVGKEMSRESARRAAEVLARAAEATDVRSSSDLLRCRLTEHNDDAYARDDDDELCLLAARRVWSQTRDLAMLNSYILEAVAWPPPMPPGRVGSLNSRSWSTRRGVEAAQIDGYIAPRAPSETLYLDYAPALRSMVASEAANAECSARRRFVYNYKCSL